MTRDEFRQIALSLPATSEGAHMKHPDFRVRGKIFATLGFPDTDWGVAMLTPKQQKEFVQAEPAVFEPFPGGWGRKGATRVNLEPANEEIVRRALNTYLP